MSQRSDRNKKSPFTVILIIIIIVCLAVIFALKILPELTKSEKQDQTISSNETSKTTSESSKSDQTEDDNELGDTITYKGKKYKYNNHLTNTLILGIDKASNDGVEVGSAEAGQSDSIYLISVDRVTEKVTQIKIPRDTMTRIEKFYNDGTSAGYSTDHLSLQYGYGDGKFESCKLTKEAVENLFYGIRITDYCAVNMDCITALASLAGEVKVVVPDDSLEYKYPEFKAGEEVTLTKDNTEIFVRSRDVDTTQSSIARDNRQNVYINAYMELTRQRASEDIHFLTDIYETIEPYMTTNMNNGQFIKLLDQIIFNSEREELQLPGEGVSTEAFDEFHVDDDALYEMVIDVFYTEVE